MGFAIKAVGVESIRPNKKIKTIFAFLIHFLNIFFYQPGAGDSVGT